VLTGPVSASYPAGAAVMISWMAGGVTPGSNVSLCYETTPYFTGNEHWIEIGGVQAANGAYSYTWNTTGVAPGTYYVAGYLWNGSSATFSHLTQSISITAATTGVKRPALSPGDALLASRLQLSDSANESPRAAMGEDSSSGAAAFLSETVPVHSAVLDADTGETTDYTYPVSAKQADVPQSATVVPGMETAQSDSGSEDRSDLSDLMVRFTHPTDLEHWQSQWHSAVDEALTALYA
jgi:hypothetical protein